MKKSSKRLQLNRETLRELAQPQLSAAVGASTTACICSAPPGCKVYATGL